MSRVETPPFGLTTYRDRRILLAQGLTRPVLLMGCRPVLRNLPMVQHPFRQDSTFLYFTGCTLPFAACLIAPDGSSTLFLPPVEKGDALWHGERPGIDEVREHFGFERVEPLGRLETICSEGPTPYTLAVADQTANKVAADICATPLHFGKHHGHGELVNRVINMRRVKSDQEVAQIRQAANQTNQAFRAIMAATKEGSTEQALTALFEGVLASHGSTTGYGTILSQRGEVLHNDQHTLTLANDSLLLVDGGAEVSSGYGCDVTRTWPVSGKFSPLQATIYAAVLEAQKASIALCREGVAYRDVHDASSRVIAQCLIDEGIIETTADQAVLSGAHALFFPHGIGHHLGLDVHDLENFGDLPSYPPNTSRPDQFGTSFLRLNLPLEAGWVVTVEPGFYVVPAILNDPTLREKFKDIVNFDRAGTLIGFGGIRIEDDVLITRGEPDILTADIPKEITELETLIGTSSSAESRFQP